MRIGVDAGGTFTDFVILHDDGRLQAFKLRSNPRDPAEVILQGLRQAGAPHRVHIVHGSTVATNALLERKGARTAFITTEGFEDLIEIGRQNREELYNLMPAARKILVEHSLRIGVKERTYFDGTIARKPSAAELRRLTGALRRAKVQSVAICFLHSYQNPVNEQAVLRALREFPACASHEICPEHREYERASTTFVNAYVRPLMEDYLSHLGKSRGFIVSILQSNGGYLSIKDASRHAVCTILSGPAGGVIGATKVAKRSKFRRVLAFDMGGTSTDVSLSDGEPRETNEAFVDGLPIRIPMLDIHTVGAGGGSIARVDAGGLLRVGPESAGAEPGPACYGKGLDATVTDAHVVLGRISEQQLLGGTMNIDPARSTTVIEKIARALKTGIDQAAAGIIRVANANMERAIRAVSTERGYDPRDFALVAFGGSGGLHACEMAQELDIRTVVVPVYAGALSALGMLLADEMRDYAQGSLGRTDLAEIFETLERAGRRDLPEAQMERSADIRYHGQSYELTIRADHLSKLPQKFHAEHKRVYGYSAPEREIEIVTLRVRARKKTPPIDLLAKKFTRSAGQEMPARRRLFINASWRDVPVWKREQLRSNAQNGPSLILDYGSTTLVPPGWAYRVDRVNNLIIEKR